MKYPLLNGRIYEIQGDQNTTRRCYEDNLRLRMANIYHIIAPQSANIGVKFVDLYPRIEPDRERITLADEMKEIHIGS